MQQSLCFHFENFLRSSIYERAIEAAGLEFRSDKLWEHYISWTTNLGHLNATTKIYDRLLQTTTQMYYQNWEK